jgi:hypothetical protein
MRFPAESLDIKVVEPLRRVSREERERLIYDAGLNIFAVLADSIYVDQRNGKPRVGARLQHVSKAVVDSKGQRIRRRIEPWQRKSRAIALFA